MAARFFVNGGVNTNWSSTSNWSTTSGGGGGSAVPSASDDVTFDANSTIDCVLDTPTAKVCKSLTLTNYTHTLTFNVTLTATPATGQTCALGASMTFAGASKLIFFGPTSGTGTLTSNGKTVNIPLEINGNSTTWTLGDNWTVTGALTLPGTGVCTINSNTLNVGGSMTVGSGSTRTNGTTSVVLNGTGTVTSAGNANGTLDMDLTINTAGTITFTGTFYWGDRANHTFLYTAGTVVASACTLQVAGQSATMTLNLGASVAWSAFVFSVNAWTLTLAADLYVNGSVTYSSSGTQIANGAFNLRVGGSWTIAASVSQRGTATFLLNGTGTWSIPGTDCRNSVTINTAGTITFSGTMGYQGGTITYTAGTIAAASSPILNILAACTLALGGATFPVGITCTVAGTIITWASGCVFVAPATITLLGTAASTVKFVSSVPATQRVVTVPSGCILDIGYTDATDIDSSVGAPVYHFKGTMSNTLNWPALTPLTAGGALSGVSVPLVG
jgi:hypothetical protein